MMLTAKTLAALSTACDNLGISFRRYSGRAMYGSHCFAIDTDRGTSAASVAFRIALELSSVDEDELLEDLASVDWREDSMGLDGIMYAPSLRWPDGLEASDSEEEECGDELDDPMTYDEAH